MRRPYRRLHLSLLLLSAFSLLSGCAISLAPTPNALPAGDSLTIAMSRDPGTADAQLTAEEYFLPLNLFDRLVEAKTIAPGRSEIVPALAASWEVSDDGLVYTFYLRRDVLFHNGMPLTADDVVYTFDRMLNPATKALNSDFLDMILGAAERLGGTATSTAGLLAVDDYTLQITLAEPYAAFLPSLATPACSIYSRTATEALGGRFGVQPIGTGPFMLSEWRFDSRIVLTAFADYYRGAPGLKTLTALILPDAETQRMLFEAGKLDIYDLDLNRFQIPYFRDHPLYSNWIVAAPRVGTYFLALNQAVAPLDNLMLRRAIAHAIDREALLDAFFYGSGTVAKGVLAPGLYGYNTVLPGFAYDPDYARSLVAASGVAEPELVIWQTNGGIHSLFINEVLQGMLGNVGFRVTIKQVDAGVWHATRRQGEEMMCYYSNWSADFDDPDNFLYTFFAAENNRQRSFNITEPRLQGLLHRGRFALAPEERLAAYHEAEWLAVYEELAFIPLFHLEHLFVVNPRVLGFAVTWNGWSDMCYYGISIAG